MIRPLRRRHDVIFAVLALALPLLLAAALSVRPDDAAIRIDVPAPLLETEGTLGQAGTPGADVETPLGGTPRQAPATLALQIDQLPNHPALLLYWVPRLSTAPGADGMLPGDARFLGAPRSGTAVRYALPAEALSGDGALVLYSLGHQRIVGEPVALDAAALAGTLTLGSHR